MSLEMTQSGSTTFHVDWFVCYLLVMRGVALCHLIVFHLNFMRQFLKGMFEEMLGHEIPFVCLMINGQESFRAHIHEVQVQHRVWFSMEKPPFIFYLRHSGDIKKRVKELL